MSAQIEKEYEADPRKHFLENTLAKNLQAQGPPLTPIAGALQGLQLLTAAWMNNRIRTEYKDRKDKYSADLRNALLGLPPGAGTPDLADVLIKSKNPDVAEEGVKLLARGLNAAKAEKFGLQVVQDAAGKAYQLRSSGGVQEIPGFVPAPERMQLVRTGQQSFFADPRTGQPVGQAFEEQTTPGQELSAAIRQQEGALNRAAQLQAAEISQKGTLALAGATQAEARYETLLQKDLAKADAEGFSKEVYPKAKAAARSIAIIERAEKNIDKAYTGAGAAKRFEVLGTISGAARALSLVPDKDFDKVQATNILDQALTTLGVAGMKELIGEGRNLSDADLKAAMKSVGTISSDPASIRAVLAELRGSFARSVDESNAFVDQRVRSGLREYGNRYIDLPGRKIPSRSDIAKLGDERALIELRKLSPAELEQYEAQPEQESQFDQQIQDFEAQGRPRDFRPSAPPARTPTGHDDHPLGDMTDAEHVEYHSRPDLDAPAPAPATPAADDPNRQLTPEELARYRALQGRNQ